MAENTNNVFINCPFDDDYKLLFRAIVFTVYRAGFYPRCATEEDNGLDVRLTKILRIISECRYGIHDISRTQVNQNGYPRFNMPFELGLFFACKHFGAEHANKNGLILESNLYSYQQTISDLNGVDTREHQNSCEQVITRVTNWLRTSSRRTTIPGPQVIINNFERFEQDFPAIANQAGLPLLEMTFNDLAAIIEDWLQANRHNIDVQLH